MTSFASVPINLLSFYLSLPYPLFVLKSRRMDREMEFNDDDLFNLLEFFLHFMGCTFQQAAGYTTDIR